MSKNKFCHLNDIESTKGEIDLPAEADYSPTLPVNTLQEEKEEYLPPDHGDICWTKGAETFTRKEVFMLLWTQRAMIINDLKNYAGDDLTDKIYQVLNFPRKPEF